MPKLQVTLEGQSFEVVIDPHTHQASINGQTLAVQFPDGPFAEIEWALVNGRPYEIEFDPALRWIKAHEGQYRLEIRDLEASVARPRSGDGRVKAPIPGLLTRLLINVGDEVETGQPILVLEAMKMENEIRAPRTGKITSISAQIGQTVVKDQLLAEIE